MKQYVMFDLSRKGHDAKLSDFARVVRNSLFVLFTEEDIFTFRKAAFALGLALDERYGGAPMQIILDTLPNGYFLVAKTDNPSEVVFASFHEIRGRYEAKDNNKNE